MKRIYIIFLFLLAIIGAYAQSEEKITFEIDAPKEVLVEQQFRLSYTLKQAQGSDLDISFDKIKNAEVLYGPSVSTMSQSRSEGREFVMSFSEVYTYVLQASEKEGTITIPDATIEVKGKEYTAKGVKIKVVKNINSGKNTEKNSSKIDKNKDKGASKKNKEISDKDVFIKAIVSRRSAGIGDPIEITYRLYTTQDVAQVADYTVPSFSGFSVKNVSTSDGDDFVEEKYEGKKYKAMDISRYIIYPKKTGKFDIEPFNLILLFDSEQDKKKIEQMTRRERYNSMIRKKVSSETISIIVGTVL